MPLLLADAVIAFGALYVALLLRFEFAVPPRFRAVFLPCAGLAVAVKLLFLLLFRMHHVQWRYGGLRDLLRLAAASTLGTVIFTAVLSFLQLGGFPQVLPRTVLVIDFLIATALFGALRLVPRLAGSFHVRTAGRKPAVIYGAGNAGEQLVRDMLQHTEYPYFPAGFVDDDPRKWGTTIHGVRVLGDGNWLAAGAERLDIEMAIVALPSASARQIRRIVEKIRAAEIPEVRILPGLDRIVSGRVTVNLIREVDLEDLMGREPVSIDTAEVESYLKDKRVLVTGAAGSIGSELVRQVLRFGAEKVCLLDHDETEMYNLVEGLSKEDRTRVDAQIADVRDADRIDALFASFRPETVFHAAAYKHVPMIEPHPFEAVQTNVFGTRNVASSALRHGCGKVILISTDKAVNPSSVMGVTKRIAETVIRAMAQDAKCTFAAVRFGNVLGSRGSVVPVFRGQIARGGPVTVTHPEMKRYFMTVQEACLLVLQASALAAGGEVLVLDMGEPVRIVDLAREMIRLSGFEPDGDIHVVFSGVRPGEKLFEEYLTAEEGVDATKHQKIFVARMTRDLAGDELERKLALLQSTTDADALRTLFRETVPTYRPADAQEKSPVGDSV
jgi:FlaA1/EpsC-like NDP-sugar epimerase